MNKFNKASVFKDGKWAHVFSDENCSRNCPVNPVLVLGVLDSELIVHVPDWDLTSVLDLLIFSFLIRFMFIPCFLSK